MRHLEERKLKRNAGQVVVFRGDDRIRKLTIGPSCTQSKVAPLSHIHAHHSDTPTLKYYPLAFIGFSTHRSIHF
jgi:hypothetical protein